MKIYDVVIIGAGSAGLMSAQLIAQKGFKVALIEQKKDLLDLPFSTLGSFMNVGEFGLSDKVIASKITTGDFHSRSVSFTKEAYNVNIIDKYQLHRELIDKCEANSVTIISGNRVRDIEIDQSGSISRIVTDTSQNFSGKLFIDCTGTSGLLSKKVGLQDKNPKIGVGVEYNVHYTGDPHKAIFFLGGDISGGYGWVFPLGKNRAIVGFATMDNSVRKDIDTAFKRVLENEHIRGDIKIDDRKKHGGTLPITDVKTQFVKSNLVCVGDSVSQYNPIVGEGYVFILDSATMASKAIIRSLESDNLEILHEYEKEWLEKYDSYYRYAKLLQRALVRATKRDLTADIGMFFLKTKSSETINKIISGRFGMKELLLP
jgi:digeranylgeranylglycerophospholipid reductase